MKQSLQPPLFAPIHWKAATGVAALGTLLTTLVLTATLKTNSWTPVPAVVAESEVLTEAGGDRRLALSYSYSVAGLTYAGSVLGPTGGESPESLAARYPVGQTVTCHVNPANPRQALLRTGASRAHWAWSGVCLLSTIALGVGARRASEQQRIAEAATLLSLETATRSTPAPLGKSAAPRADAQRPTWQQAA